MTSYLEIYQDARRKLDPIDSLYYVISDASQTHPSLKQFFNQDRNNLIGALNRSARILLHCIRDIEDFTKDGIKEATVEFVREQLVRALAHLQYYLGAEVVAQFIGEVSETPINDLMFGVSPNPEIVEAWMRRGWGIVQPL